MIVHNTSTSRLAWEVQENGIMVGDLVMYYISFFLKVYVNPFLSFTGIFINIINAAIFYKMGLSEGIAQNFFILSVSDGILAVSSFAASSSNVLLNTLYTRGGLIAELLQSVHWVAMSCWPFSHTISFITTTVIAVVRCCCVTMPLQVKDILTARRQLLAIVVFCLIGYIVMIYSFAPVKLIRITNPMTNITHVTISGLRYFVIDIFAGTYLKFAFITVVVCTVILIFSLKQSSRFRETSSSASGSVEKRREKSREIRTVQTVILVATIFIVFNLPLLVLSIARMATDSASLYADGSVWRLLELFLLIMDVCMMFNINLNIFIYVRFNSRYRNIFMKIVGNRSDRKPVTINSQTQRNNV
ncbi:hypothetical protein RRG08_051084 [Elysia crispata]|uniref:G-protein coupled receptors family 1 profile domain-containing protein n=1 Tax=Elysia crispata TaxID=231223 RepID=A0AAE1DWY6_9GAST|nr:hypothetical protein RRG08_051084 [Elysia crispata]